MMQQYFVRIFQQFIALFKGFIFSENDEDFEWKFGEWEAVAIA